jgi:hypothetical protein
VDANPHRLRVSTSPQRVRPTRITARPETHQPLHTDNEQSLHQTRQNHADASAPRTIPKDPIGIHPMTQPDPPASNTQKVTPKWWRRTGSNRRPPACKAGALPAELRPQTGQTQTTQQLQVEPSGGCHASSASRSNHEMVGQGGLEPPTPRLSSVCSNQLSY